MSNRENLDIWIQSQQEVACRIRETGCFIEFQYGETTVGRRKTGGIVDKVRSSAKLRNALFTALDKLRCTIQ